MSTSLTERSQGDLGREATELSLAHFGVRGMKWGVRRTDAQIREATPVIAKTKTGSSKIEVTGGKGHPASDDAIKVAAAKQKLSGSGMNALSNAELKAITDRMNMESKFAEAVAKLPPKHPGRAMVKKMIKQQGEQELKGLVTGKPGVWTTRMGLLLTTTAGARKAPKQTMAALGVAGTAKVGAKAVKGAFTRGGGKHRKLSKP